MKRVVLAVAAISLVLMNYLSNPLSLIASTWKGDEIELSVEYADWYDEEGNLKYPMTKENPEWKYLNGPEGRYEACQIPEEILKSLSTEEVLQMVLEYPNFSSFQIYDDEVMNFENLRQNFNGLEELLSREDCKEVVLETYKDWEIPEESMYDYDANISKETGVADMNAILKDEEAMKLVRHDAHEKYCVDILEAILSCDDMQGELTEDDVSVLTDALVEKVKMKAVSACFDYDGTSCCYSGMVDGSIQAEPRLATIRTRSGTPVSWYVESNISVMTYAQSMSYLDGLIDCQLVEVGTTEYNCIAYAWLSLDSWNAPYRKSVQISNDERFRNDSAYYKSTSALKVEQVTTWSDGHAGVVYQISYTYDLGHSNYTTEPLIISKWGLGPLVIHPLSQCPYENWSQCFYK